jgi:uncharacterized membrane protein
MVLIDMPVLLPVHVVAGGLAILLGAAALLAPKGATLHRKVGLLFVYAMLAMGFSGSVLALRESVANPNVMGGFMSAYFVVTALTAVRPPSNWTRGLNIAALVVAAGLVVLDVSLGMKAFASPRGTINGVPYFMPFFLAAVTIAAASGDVRAMKAGSLKGAARLSRHLWRMCFALFIAAGSFFSIRSRVAKIFPEPFTTGPMRALPVLLVFAAMFYWLWKIRGRKTLTFVANVRLP